MFCFILLACTAYMFYRLDRQCKLDRVLCTYWVGFLHVIILYDQLNQQVPIENAHTRSNRVPNYTMPKQSEAADIPCSSGQKTLVVATPVLGRSDVARVDVVSHPDPRTSFHCARIFDFSGRLLLKEAEESLIKPDVWFANRAIAMITLSEKYCILG